MTRDLADRIASLPKPLLLAFDVDGTLAQIVRDPVRAFVPEETVRKLRDLAAREGVSIAIVTGRDLSGVDGVLRIDEAWMAVEHGRCFTAPGRTSTAWAEPHPAARKRLERFRAWAHMHAEPAGARIEEKQGSIAVHARALAESDREAAETLLARAKAAAIENGLHALEGRAVIEALARHADKGMALAQIADRAGAKSIAYAGDDRTDDPAIEYASKNGIGIFVRSSERPDAPPFARAVLAGPEEVAALISDLHVVIA